MIRRAELRDLPALLVMGREFFLKSGFERFAPWDDDAARVTFERMITGEVSGGLLIDKKGMAGFVLYPFYFNFNCSVGQEIFWYGSAALLDAMEQEARLAGAGVFMMASVSGLRDAALARLYRSRGYVAAENTFIKRL